VANPIVANGQQRPAAPRLFASTDRRSPALWEIASDAGKRVGVVNWLVTYPVEPVNGFVITDRYVPVSATFLATSLGADLERDDRRLFYPPALGATLAKVPIAKRTALPLTPAQAEEVDREIFSLAYAARDAYPVDLLLIYTRSMDELSHLLWATHERLPGEPPGPDLIVELVQRYDTLLGELLARLGPRDHLVVLSDHGMERSAKSGLSGTHASRAVAVGVCFLWGPGVRAGGRPPPASPYDVLPTVLELVGIPPSKAMQGRVFTSAFAEGYVPRPRQERVFARHETAPVAPASAADESIVERLKALGYVQ
jgi:hypothetical protein